MATAAAAGADPAPAAAMMASLTDQQLAAALGLNLVSVCGPILLGLLFSLVVLGAAYTLAIRYYRIHGIRDAGSYLYPIVLGLSLALVTAGLGVVCSMVWSMAITATYLQTAMTVTAQYKAMVWTIYLALFMCQSTFAYRYWLATRRWYIAGFIELIAAASLLFILIAATIGDDLAPLLGSTEKGIFNVERAVQISLWMSLAVDLLLTLVWTQFLYGLKAGFNKSTDALVDRLAAMTLSNAAVTSALQLGAAVSIRAADSFSTVPIFFLVLAAPCYVVCLEHTLLVRSTSQDGSSRTHPTASYGSSHAKVRSYGITTPINITTSTHRHVDASETLAEEKAAGAGRFSYPPPSPHERPSAEV